MKEELEDEKNEKIEKVRDNIQDEITELKRRESEKLEEERLKVADRIEKVVFKRTKAFSLCILLVSFTLIKFIYHFKYI